MLLDCIELQQFTIIILEVIMGHNEGKLLFPLDFLDILVQSNAILQLLSMVPFFMCDAKWKKIDFKCDFGIVLLKRDVLDLFQQHI